MKEVKDNLTPLVMAHLGMPRAGFCLTKERGCNAP